MASRHTPCPDPPVHSSEEGDGVARCCSPRLDPQIEAAEEGADMSCRRDGNSPAAPASLPDDDNMLREVLLRLPPQPSSLPRATAVCRRWRRLVTDPKFHRQYRFHHRKPPLLGVFQHTDKGTVFNPINDPPDRVPPQRFNIGCCSSSDYEFLDCRHGLVLFKDRARNQVVVCDPITGEQRRVAIPPDFKKKVLRGVVLCASGNHGHVHGDCHSSPFKVVVLVHGYFLVNNEYDYRSIACVYSSETGIWGNQISTETPFKLPYKAAVLVGNCLYWLTLYNGIIEFDLDQHNLTLICEPPGTMGIHYENCWIIQGKDGAFGFAVLSCARLQMWQRNVDYHGVATWMLWKNIEMHSIFELPPQTEDVVTFIAGYDEDTDVMFFSVSGNVYMVQLISMESRKLYETIGTHDHHPFKSFYTPGTTIGGSNEADLLPDA